MWDDDTSIYIPKERKRDEVDDDEWGEKKRSPGRQPSQATCSVFL